MFQNSCCQGCNSTACNNIGCVSGNVGSCSSNCGCGCGVGGCVSGCGSNGGCGNVGGVVSGCVNNNGCRIRRTTCVTRTTCRTQICPAFNSCC